MTHPTYENANPRPPFTEAEWHAHLVCAACGEVDVKHMINLGPRYMCGACVERLVEMVRERVWVRDAAKAHGPYPGAWRKVEDL